MRHQTRYVFLRRGERFPRFLPILWILLLLGVWSPLAEEELAFDFEREPLDQIPNGFRSLLSGRGTAGNWRIISTEVPPRIAPLTSKAAPIRRRVLAQLSEDITDERFPLLIYDGQTFGDLKFTTRFKNVSGAFEQMAGIVFRARDEANYYYVRASSLGNTLRFFKVVNGLRSDAVGVDVEVPGGEWHDLAVDCRGNQIKVFLNGEQLIPTITDNTFSSGKIGFWTKSDAVAYFADTHVTYTPRETLPQALVREAVRRYPRLLELRIYAPSETGAAPKVVGSTEEALLNSLGGDVERNVIDNDAVYFGKSSHRVTVTMPLHDRNGEPIAAVRLVMKSFRGQTERNAIVRATPIVEEMEARTRSIKSLIE